jgi:capsular polysaccharide biosynthesis protein
MSRSDSRRKFLVEARRRGWVVVCSAALVILVALAVDSSRPSTSTAEGVLVVKAAGPLSEQPNSSTKLAGTYATLISLDRQIELAVEKALPNWTGSYTSSNDPNTAVIRIDFTGDSTSEAIEGTRVLAGAVTGPRPVTRNITPNTINVANLPDSASESGVSPAMLVVAGLLGLLLGFVVLGFWRPRDARVDTLRELRQQLECPCLSIDLSTKMGLQSVFDALADMVGRTTAIVPARGPDAAVAAAVARVLNNAFGQGRVDVSGAPGPEEAGELVAAGADTTILVTRPGVRASALVEAAEILKRYEAAPSFAILVSGNPDAVQDPPSPADGVATPASH